MPTPLTVDCGCAFHPKIGEVGESLLVLTYCPTHAAAQKAVAILRALYMAKSQSTQALRHAADDHDDDARALLASIDQNGG